VEGELRTLSLFCAPVISLTLSSVVQMIVERWRQSSPADFWAEFSSEGKHLSFTAITERLRLSRKAEDERICELAKIEYGTLFAETFSYRKGGVTKVMTDPAIVAKHWRSLHE
jgi:hypothetical protein